MKRRYIAIALALLFVLAGVSLALIPFYVDWLWFTEVGYTSVFLKIILTSAGVGVLSGLIFFLFVVLNLLVTRKLAPKYWYVSEAPVLEQIRQFFRKASLWLILGASSVIAILAGLATSGEYDKVLKFINASSFGQKDPVFGLDIGFYVFKLPFYQFIFGWLVTLLFTTAIAIAITYLFDGSIEIRPSGVRLLPHVKGHLSILIALFFANLAFNYRLQMYKLLYSSRGLISGAGYTDTHANLPVLWILLAAALIAAAITLINVRFKGWLYPAVAAGILIVTSLVAGTIYPAFIENYRVKPNQLKAETPFIKRTIEGTQKAYGLDKVREVDFKIDNNLTIADINQSKATVENIRLWDWRPLLTTYRQIQEIRPYYVFNDVDIDRYLINGVKRQVVLAARELSTEKLQDKAKTWVNQHMVFTHGYGLAMNAVNEVSSEGLPEFLIKDLPPDSKTKELKITQPRIYFGETATAADYAIVNTDNAEFDYPAEGKNVTSHYKGTGGFAIGSFFKKLALAYNYSDINMLISSAIKPDSRIIINRNVLGRIEKIAPFLTFDNDPYMVIDKGRLFWIIDGYTSTDNYPYSQPFGGDYNYIRNSVKVVVDAYSGQTDFYMVDENEPIVKTYSKIFPKAFKPLAKMPKGLRAHLRYPEDLFSLQSQVYATYHMTNPQVFYNKEDEWSIPKEIFEGSEQTVEPYYVILQLAESKNDFQLIRPFTPAGKNNMISWMSINSEPDKYGEVLLYQFSRKELVYGPSQIEARIDQQPDISERFSLWNQRGSRVIRGNLLVIPIKNSLLFVEPIYIQSDQSQIPELKRVIMVFGDKVAMGTTFEEALQGIFTGKVTPSKEQAPTAGTEGQSQAELIKKATTLYSEAIEAQKKGDWATYGAKLEELGTVLQQLQQK